jgi:hypothetical protein
MAMHISMIPHSLYLARMAFAFFPREKNTHAETARKAIPTKTYRMKYLVFIRLFH